MAGVGVDFNHIWPDANGDFGQWFGTPTPAPAPKWQPDDEAWWCHVFDTQLATMSAERKARLVTAMDSRADAIWALAHEGGKVDWAFRNRGIRFHALWTRLHP